MNTVIFTDLDGTFLNHDNYSFKESYEARKLVLLKKIPLIFNTSKTKDEALLLQDDVGIKEPFIIENGAAIYFPKNYNNFDLTFLDEIDNFHVFILGKEYKEILRFYNNFKDEYKMKGFSDMSLQEVSSLTGLSINRCELSVKRGFTEPFIIEDESKVIELSKKAKEYGIKITKGGRFYHLMGENQDKGMAIKKTIEIFEKLYDDKIKSIGLGDGQNDIAMFENVDLPIIIKNHEGNYVAYENENVQKSTFKGAKGWNEMVLKNV